MDVLEQKIRELPIKKLKLNPTSVMGSYVDSSVEMVKLEDTLQLIKKMLSEPELRGLTGLVDQFRREIEKEIKSLPVKIFKIDPFSQYNKSATLFVEEEYVELNDVMNLIYRKREKFEEISSFIIECLCQLVKWKEERLSESDRVQLVGGDRTFPNLQGAKGEVDRALAIREGAIASLEKYESIDNLSPRAKAILKEILSKMTSAAWWIENSHRTTFAILLQLSNALDEALLLKMGEVSQRRF